MASYFRGLEQLPQIFVQVFNRNLEPRPASYCCLHHALGVAFCFLTSGTHWLRRTRGTQILNTFPGVLTSWVESFLPLCTLAASSFCGFKQLPSSVDLSIFLLLWTRAISSFCGLAQLPPSVDLSSFLLLWIQAASSFCGLEQLPPSVDSSNYLQKI